MPPSAGLLNLKGYQIEHKMKHSGIGRIYKATATKTGRPVVIKTLLPQGNVDPYHVSVFQRELNILRQLKHKHIVRFLEYGRTEDLFYFIFEFVEGMDLAKFIQSKGGRVSIHDTAPIALGILDGLAYAHHAKITSETAEGQTKTFSGIVHRNLKPQNILLMSQAELWVPKIADFGLSKSFESAGFTNITTPGDVFGTPLYWPREQITHYRYLTPATDVFSIAAVFYEMLTGARVREGFQELAHKYKQLGRLPSISDYMSVIATNPPIPIRQRNPNIPEPLAKVIDQALREIEIPQDEVKMREILRTLRYPDAGAFRNALVKAFREIGVPESLITAQEWYHAPAEADLAREQHETAQLPTEAVMYSTIQPTSRREVALLVLDIARSTQYLLNKGDTVFSTLIGNIFRRIKTQAAASDLIFLKGSGDGFLSVFQTVPAAFSVAATFLETPIHPEIQVRMALHWGAVKIISNGDVVGTEISRVFQVEKVSIEDRVEPATSKEPFPSANRILATTQALQRLEPAAQARFRPAGKFRLKGFDKFGELWVWQKVEDWKCRF